MENGGLPLDQDKWAWLFSWEIESIVTGALAGVCDSAFIVDVSTTMNKKIFKTEILFFISWI